LFLRTGPFFSCPRSGGRFGVFFFLFVRQENAFCLLTGLISSHIPPKARRCRPSGTVPQTRERFVGLNSHAWERMRCFFGDEALLLPWSKMGFVPGRRFSWSVPVVSFFFFRPCSDLALFVLKSPASPHPRSPKIPSPFWGLPIFFPPLEVL